MIAPVAPGCEAAYRAAVAAAAAAAPPPPPESASLARRLLGPGIRAHAQATAAGAVGADAA